MSDDEQTRDEIEYIINDEPVQEAVIETVVEEKEERKTKPVKTKSKAKAEPKIKITKQPIGPVETIEPQPVIEVEEQLNKH